MTTVNGRKFLNGNTDLYFIYMYLFHLNKQELIKIPTYLFCNPEKTIFPHLNKIIIIFRNV